MPASENARNPQPESSDRQGGSMLLGKPDQDGRSRNREYSQWDDQIWGRRSVSVLFHEESNLFRFESSQAIIFS